MIKKKISIIFPVYNEAKNLLLIESEISKLKLGLNYETECIFINDGSQDHSWQILEILILRNKNFKAINFSRNFGHQSAITAGLIEAKGDAIIMLDSDLQHPIELIPDLITKWEAGYEIVNTQRLDLNNIANPLKKILSNLFYRLFNVLSETKLLTGGADFRLLDAKVVRVLLNLNEVDKFYRGLVPWVGFKSTFITYTSKVRKFGKSNYSFEKMLSLGISGISSFSTRPLKIIFIFGSSLFILSSMGIVLVCIYRYFLGSIIFTGTSVLVFLVLITNSIQLIAIGLLSYFVYGINKEVKKRPPFIIQDRIDSELTSEKYHIKKAE